MITKTLITCPMICMMLISFSVLKAQNNNIIEDLIEEAKIPGLSLAYFENDHIITSESYGYSNIDGKVPVNEETIFSAASLSKPIFAYIVLQLMEEDKIDLDRPLYTYYHYPDLGHDERYKDITARMVLSHTAGLPNWRKSKLEFKHTPGEKFNYSGEGFVFLQKTVEKITGQSLEQLAQERVFIPLKMSHTSYVWLPGFDDNYALPYDQKLKPDKKYRPFHANAAHSLQTTATDYALFLMAILGHQGLSENTVTQMLTPQVTVTTYEKDQEEVDWGLGVGIQQTKDGIEYWHWGDNNTFKAYFTVSISKKKGLVYFTNGKNGLSITPDIVGMYIGSNQPGWKWNDYKYYK